MNFLNHPFFLERRRRRWARRLDGPLGEYLAADLAAPDVELGRTEFLAIDLETTGLDPCRDEILSIGYAPLINCALRLGEHGHHFIRPNQPIPEQTAVIHGILDDRASGGRSLEAILPRVLDALKGRVLLAHYSVLEFNFLNAACWRLYGGPLVVPIVDTLALESRRLHRFQHAPRPGDLKLAAVRNRYGLPPYPAHDALTDAVAAGELFLAQAAHWADGCHPPLREFLLAAPGLRRRPCPRRSTRRES